MEDLLQVGVITTTHGIRGEVKVYPTTDDAHRFEDLTYILLDTGKDVDNINDIEPYKGRSLYVTREFAVPLKENEYYIADLIDMKVFLEDGSFFGTLKDVMETGANDVYVMQTEAFGEVLVPAIKDCIKAVDVEQGTMTIHLLEGLC